MNNEKTLIELIQENPELPVIPLVDSEVVAEDYYTWWLGKWGQAEIGHYYLGKERVLIKEWDDDEDILNDVFPEWEDYSDEYLRGVIQRVKWVKAIIVKITA